MGTHLEWSDIRPTQLRAVGRSGVEYRIEQRDGAWSLFRFTSAADRGVAVSSGWLADMKALADQHEADALGTAPAPQRIDWAKVKPGHYWGVAPIGFGYRILKVGMVEGAPLWRLEQFPNEDAEHGTIVDEGSLGAMKAAAVRRATAAAAELVREVGVA